MFFNRRVTTHEVLQKLDSLEHEVESLRRNLRDLTESLENLADKHIRLRGRVYASKLHKPEEEETTPKAMTRAELKASLARTGRFVPGRAAIHQSDIED